MKKFKFDGLKQAISTAKNMSIVSHRNPDGDAVGSSLALYICLKEIYPEKSIQVILPNKYPAFLEWLPRQDEILFFEQNPSTSTEILQQSDLVFTLDFNDFNRTGHQMAEILSALNTDFVMIDHHQQPSEYAKYLYSDTSIGSTCEMIYESFVYLGFEDSLNQQVGECLYTGIMTDTGSFKFPSTSSRTHQIIGKLIDLGIENSKIHQSTFDQNSVNRLQLLGVAMRNLRIIEQHQVAYISLSQQELDQHQFQKGDTEGFVNYGLSIKGINFAAIFIENKQEHIIKISFRSVGDVDVNKFAREHFDGGGHKNAAGGKSNLSLEETIRKFEKIIKNDY